MGRIYDGRNMAACIANTNPLRLSWNEIQAKWAANSTAVEITDGYSDGEIDCGGTEGVDLTRADLRHADFLGADAYNQVPFRFSHFDQAKLDGVNLSSVDMTAASFTSASLIGAHLTRSTLVGANFIEANLTAANLSQANLGVADLASATLDLADLSEARLIAVRLSGASLIGASLAGADLTGARLGRFDGSKSNGALQTEAPLPAARISATEAPRKAGLIWCRLNGCHPGPSGPAEMGCNSRFDKTSGRRRRAKRK